MKVAYVFRNNMASTFQLATMILPQLENDTHGVEVGGMFFFDDNVYCLREGDSIGERLARVAEDRGMLLRSAINAPSGVASQRATLTSAAPGASRRPARCGVSLPAASLSCTRRWAAIPPTRSSRFDPQI